MRGENGIYYNSSNNNTRFTPTCVGKTGGAGGGVGTVMVHPHVRGENLELQTGEPVIVGSPPRAWGKLYLCADNSENTRFTPTCVGKTIVDRSVQFTEEVHPHVRGENCMAIY